MPSPIGHALAGATLALLSARPSSPATHDAGAFAPHPQGRHGYHATVSIRLAVCVLCAALPDADLLYQPLHRAFTHSIGSTILVTIVAAVVTGWVTDRRAVAFGLLCGAAWASHTVLDWLGADPNPPRGIQALWPFSDQWFISGWDLFRGTERRRIFTLPSILYNARAVAQEVAILTPPLAIVVWMRSRNRASRRTGG